MRRVRGRFTPASKACCPGVASFVDDINSYQQFGPPQLTFADKVNMAASSRST